MERNGQGMCTTQKNTHTIVNCLSLPNVYNTIETISYTKSNYVSDVINMVLMMYLNELVI